MEQHRVCIIGSGNFGSTLAKVIAENIVNLDDFDHTVRMYVYDEIVDGESLVNIINTRHENVKYLPGVPLPHNVLAIPDIAEAATDCDFYVFVTPHQFLKMPNMLPLMVGKPLPGATGLSCVKGVSIVDDHIELGTELVESVLGIPCGSLMGANIANDIAKEQFCESSIAFTEESLGYAWYNLINNKYYRIKVINDLYLQQLCGTLKNIVAMGGGFIDGLQMGQSTKAAIIRIGIEEMYKFAAWYYPDKNIRLETMLETCGVGDVVATAYGGRNRRCAEAFVKTGKDFQTIEKELLDGQKLQGNIAAAEVFKLLKIRNAVKDFPLFSTIALIAAQKIPPVAILDYEGSHLENE